MSEQIKNTWHQVLVALINGDTARADVLRERAEKLVGVQRARRETRAALRSVLP